MDIKDVQQDLEKESERLLSMIESLFEREDVKAVCAFMIGTRIMINACLNLNATPQEFEESLLHLIDKYKKINKD